MHGAVGAGHLHPCLHHGAVGVIHSPGGGDHHAVIGGVDIAAGNYAHHGAVHAQKEHHRVPNGGAAEGGELIDRLRRGERVGVARHGNRGGGEAAGGEGADRAGDPVAVDPHRLHAAVIVVDVVEVDGREAGELSVPVDRGGGGRKGQLRRAAVTDIGAAEVVRHHGSIVYLAVGDTVAQGGGVDLAAAVLGGHQIVEEIHAVPPGHQVALSAADLVPQAQSAGLAQLGGGEGARQRGGVIAQQPQHRRARLLQGDGVRGTEGAVGVADHPPLLHRQLNVGGGPMAALYIRKQGVAHIPVPHGVLIDRGPR